MTVDVILYLSAVLVFLALLIYIGFRTSGEPASLQLEAMAHDMLPPPPETKNKTTMNINIDKFELMYLLEGCSIGSHLRQGIWERCIDEFYDKLSRDERLWLYTYAKRDITPRYKRKDAVGREDFFKFLACFNPANRYMVAVEGEVDGKHKRELVDAYKYGDVFWVSYRRFIPEEYIKSVERDRVSPCSASYCMWRDSCVRYSTDPNVTDRHVLYADTKCDWYINVATEHGADMQHFED